MRQGGPAAPKAVFGTAAVALLLFGTRWGSYLGVPPLFLTDLLLGVAFVHLLVNRLAGQREHISGMRPRVVLLALVLAWGLVRLLMGWRYDQLAIRDAVPYLYAVVGIGAAGAVATCSQRARDRTARILIWALALHCCWVGIATIFPTLPDALPVVSAEQELHVFTLRGDIDTALCGVFAAWLLVVAMRRKGPLWPLVGFVITWVIILQTESRAGLIAAAGVTLLGFVAAQSSGELRESRRAATAVAIAPLILAAALLALPHTNVGQRLAGTFFAPQGDLAMGAAGTAQAREGAATAVWDYVLQDNSRFFLGVGFGTDLMGDSHAGLALVGTDAADGTAPRSPHNYWVGTAGRLGIVGLLSVGALAVAVMVRAWRQVRRPALADELGLLVALIPIAILPIASLGVVLESPFGAVPYFWAAGVLLAYPRVERSARPHGPRQLTRPAPAHSSRPVTRGT